MTHRVEITAQGVDAALRRIGQSRRLVVVEAKKLVSGNFFLKLDPLCGPVAAKPLVLELLCLEVGTSVASAVTAETVFD